MTDKQAAPRRRFATLACDSNQVGAPVLTSLDRFGDLSPEPLVAGPCPLSRMPTQLEGAMDALITVFYNYSGNDGDKHKLNKGELKQLLHSELTDFLTVKNPSSSIRSINCICIVFPKIRLFSMRFSVIPNRLNKMAAGRDRT